jgi:hypothetical protein
MSRDINDLRVALVIRALDRAVESPDANSSTGAVIDVVGSVIITLGNNCERFLGWDAGGVRAVVLAYAQNAPDEELDAMAKMAIDQHEWCVWWDAPGGGLHQAQCNGCDECGRASEAA